jgi:hypothetical protein
MLGIVGLTGQALEDGGIKTKHMNYKYLGIAAIYFTIGHVILWFQANAQFFWVWAKDHKLLMAFLFGTPVSYLFITGIDYVAQATGHDIWATRILPSMVGTIVFMVMTYFVFEQGLNLKNGICLSLTLLVLFLQVYWK